MPSSGESSITRESSHSKRVDLDQAHTLTDSGTRKPFARSFWSLLGAEGSPLRELSLARMQYLGLPGTSLLAIPYRVFFASIIINLLGLGLPLAILQVYDRIIPNQSQETMLALVVILTFVILAETMLKISRSYVVAYHATQFAHQASVYGVKYILNAKDDLMGRESVARVMERLDAIGKVGDFFGGQSRIAVIDVPFVIVFLFMIAIIGGYIVVVPLFILLVFGIISYRQSKAQRDTLQKRDEQEAKSYDFIAEILSGILTLKGMAMESLMLRRFERLAETSGRLNRDMIVESIRSQTISSMFGNTTIVLMVTIGAILAIYGDLTVGSLAACTMLAGRAVQPILRVSGSWNEFQKAAVAVNEMADLYALDVHKDEEFGSLPSAAPAILFEGIKAEEDAAGPAAWKTLDLSFEAGSLTILTGDDGTGKSTILRLVSGHSIPTVGHVKIDGVDAELYRRRYKTAIAYVSQQTEPLRGTILENLTVFGLVATADEARNACRLLGLEEDIHHLPQGYDTRLGDGVVEILSQGFIQRILIARALTVRPVVLLLDEPQAFLDERSDKLLIKALRQLKGETTIVMVCNRPSYQKIADHVLGVVDKKLVDVGKSSRVITASKEE